MGLFSNMYRIDVHDTFDSFGVVFRPNTYNELLKDAKKKEGITKSWAEQNGTQRFFNGPPVYESIQYSLPLSILAANETDFYTKFNAFKAYIKGVNYFNFDVIGMNRRFVLLYLDMPSFEKLTLIKGPDEVYCDFNIVVVNDFPNDNNVIPAT